MGACGLDGARAAGNRWIEHIRLAKLWGSRTSRRRFRSRCPVLYAAMASVSSWHVIQVVIASVPQRSVLGAERFFIRTLRPVFNWQGASDRLAKQTFSSSMLIDDVVVRASKLVDLKAVKGAGC